jgi:hypothetical protein
MTPPTRTGRLLCLVGGLGIAAGTLFYIGTLRRFHMTASEAPLQTVQTMVVAALIANVSGVALLLGLAALGDRVALRLSGLALAILLVALDYSVLDAFLGRTIGYAVAGLIGAAFLFLPWLVKRR